MTVYSSNERVPTGIPGFDKLIEGGLVKGSTYLVAGQAGTGKTIFSMQFLLEGLKKGETCVYVSLEQKIEELIGDMSNFEWGSLVKKYYDNGKLVIASVEPTSMKDLQDATLAYIGKVKASRFVLDSLTVAAFGWKVSSMDVGKLRSEIFSYMKAIETTGVTSILISEVPEGDSKKVSRFGFEEFIVDGIIKINYLGIGESDYRNLEIRKMRRTDHARGIFPMEFGKSGIKISTNRDKLHF